ncbi:MAG: HlyD family efflux transporter periplasmic adaptor subunit [Candidatus Methylacidiphilales bacterium]|nr:HlyD family efflux transporter periplasmic adaptor subunit [Candidatus Methylacidiphilales bacterium]
MTLPDTETPASSSKRRKILGAAIFVGLLVIAFSLWRHLAPVNSVYQGYVEADYLYVASPVAGRLLDLSVHRGDKTKSGQTLFRLEPNPEAEQAAETRARLVLAEQNWERAQQMMPSGSISRQQYDQNESEWKAAREAHSQIQWRLDQKTQLAPGAAYVQDTTYVPGEWVPEGRPVVVLLPPERIKIRFYVNAATLNTLRPGDLLTVKPYGGDTSFPATVNYLSTKAEYTPPVIYSNDTRDKLTFLVEAAPDPEIRERLHPGQPVEIRRAQSP